jgi:GH25 family lysozyme M1 (1,4-beta-N-acetylmuramidase)
VSVGTVTAQIAREICDNQPVGYSQGEDRRSWYAAADAYGRVPSPQSADCSSLAAGSISYGLHHTYGVPWGHQALLEPNDFWTGNLRSGMEARGFEEVPWADENLTPDGGFQVGDIVLSAGNEGGVGHVIVIVENGYDPLESEAWIAETGDIYGERGDQTGQETRTARYSGHPYTLRGAWTSCHRFNEAKFFQQWPEFAKSKPAGSPTPAITSSEPKHAHGIDVSSHQGGLNLRAIWADFVIVKITEGTGYENPFWRQQAEATLAAGKRLGFYHFANDEDAGAQARYFLDRAKSYVGRATFWLDWESDAVGLGPGPALAFLNQVAAETGTTPGFYTYQNVLNSYDWSAVAARYPLWVAGGPEYSDYGRAYSDPAVPSVPYWGSGALIHQYTEDGRLPGYSGTLDLNRLRDRSAWDAMRGGGSTGFRSAPASAAPSVSPYTGKKNKSDGQAELVCNGNFGMATIGRLQQVMGTTIDGVLDEDGSPAVERLQQFLNSAVPTDTQEALNDAPRLDEDGVLGPDTWRTLQYLIIAWHREYLPAGWDFADWVDGEPGPATIGALQRALNNSRTNSGRLW